VLRFLSHKLDRRKNRCWLILLLLPLLFLSACLGAFPPAGSGLPVWVLSPPPDSAADLIGIGEGFTIARAKASALNDIAGKLGTEVSSNIGRDVRLNGHQLKAVAHEVITARVKNTKLIHPRVLKSAKHGKKYFVLLAVSREAMFRDTNSRLRQMDQVLNQQWEALPSLSPLLQFVRVQKMASDSEKASSLARILGALDGHFKAASYLEKYNAYKKKRDALLSSTRFQIQRAKAMPALLQGLVERLSRDKIQSTLSRGLPRGADPVIEVSAKVDKRLVFATKYVHLSAVLVVKDRNGNIISSRKYKARGESLNDFAAATLKAVEHLVKQWQQRPALEILGLNI